MKIENLKLSISELLLVRQWLCAWESAMNIDGKFIHQTLEARKHIDKLLWGEIISSDTPWGKVQELSFSDDDFENTIKTILSGEKKNGETDQS
jgi:hypothetical protein